MLSIQWSLEASVILMSDVCCSVMQVYLVRDYVLSKVQHSICSVEVNQLAAHDVICLHNVHVVLLPRDAL